MQNNIISKFLNLLRNDTSIKKDLEVRSLIGKDILINKRNDYLNFKSINEAEEKIFSQNGEDGIIDYILEVINIKDPKFVEIGVEDYIESNTRLLYHIRNSQGLIVDQSIDINKLSKNLELWKGRLKVLKKSVTPKNINEIINYENFNKDLDLFSIDIDGLDFWVIKELPTNFAKICIAEYNPLFGSEHEVTVPNIENFDRTNYHHSNLCWGVSLKGLINLMDEKNFVFLGTNNLKNNAFFVNKDFEQLFKKVISEKNIGLKNFTNHKFQESRDRNGNLTYLSRKEQLKEIEDCYVINIKNSLTEKVKLSELI
tara:strand:+ start:3944 stop:4882 length:939 start_codon:yes stop_codon:yes gene_type:complete